MTRAPARGTRPPLTTPAADDTTPGTPPVAQLLDVGEIAANPANIRQDLGDLTELAASIEAVGVLSPLTVAPNPGGDPEFVLIAGHRRYAAALIACLAEVPCVIRADLTSRADVITAMLAENLHRADLTPIEEATAYEQLGICGLDTAEIARRTGRSGTTVRSRLNLMGLPQEARDRVQARQLTLDQAQQLAEFTGAPDAVARILDVLDRTGDIRFSVQQERAHLKAAADEAARRTALTARLNDLGVSIDPGSGYRGGDTLLYLLPDTAGVQVKDGIRADLLDLHAASGCPGPLTATIEPGARTATLLCLTHPRPEAAWMAAAGQRVDQILAAHDHDPEDSEDEDDQGGGGGSRAAQDGRAQDVADCQAAAAVRSEYLMQFTTGATPLTDPMREAILRFIAESAITIDEALAVDQGDYRLWLGLDPDDDEDDHGGGRQDDDDEAVLLAEVPKVKDPVAAILAIIAASAHDTLRMPWAWAPHLLTHHPASPGDPRGFLNLVGGPLGYEWTEWEAAHLAAADTAGQEPPA